MKGTWRRIRGRSPDSRDPDAANLHRIAWRLAGLSVALLIALLLAVTAGIYLVTQGTVQTSMHTVLIDRANAETHHALDEIHHRGLPYQNRWAREELEEGGVFITVTGRDLTVLGGSSTPFGRVLPDRAAARAALRSSRPRFSTGETASGQRYLLYSKPIVSKGRIVGLIQTGVAERPYENSLDALLRVLLIIGGLGLLVAAGISAVLTGRMLRPIRTALQRQRSFVADAAHELRTPVAIIRSATELGLTGKTGPEAALEQALAESNHLTRLVDDLSLLARADGGALLVEREPVDLAGLAEEAVAGIMVLAEDRAIAVRVKRQGETWVLGDAGRLRQLVLILLDNALKHTPDAGIITIELGAHRGQALLQVRDSGPGIAAADLPHLFERFYRSDSSRPAGGAGLGLAIARWIVRAHGGHIKAANAPGGGAVFSVELPLAPSSMASRQAVPGPYPGDTPAS